VFTYLDANGTQQDAYIQNSENTPVVSYYCVQSVISLLILTDEEMLPVQASSAVNSQVPCSSDAECQPGNENSTTSSTTTDEQTTTVDDQSTQFSATQVSSVETACQEPGGEQILIYAEAIPLDTGIQLFANPEKTIPLMDGFYRLADGSVITVTNGTISEYLPDHCPV
jgi:hypothetical protein